MMISRWCEQNCLAPAPFTNCPGDVCTCEDDSVAVVPQVIWQ